MSMQEINRWAFRTTPGLGDRAVVVMSGGQDSTTCLGVAIKAHGAQNVTALCFDYGQKHRVELQQAKVICETLGVARMHTVNLAPVLQSFRSSALVTGGDVGADHEYLEGRPASFVPARNALFLTAAFGFAMEDKASHIYTGVCQTDYSGYPDCRADFINGLAAAMRVGYETDIAIHTPLMDLTKAETFELAHQVEVLDEVIEHSHTCYNGVRDVHHVWGAGCGECPACELRAKGYAAWQQLREDEVRNWQDAN